MLTAILARAVADSEQERRTARTHYLKRHRLTSVYRWLLLLVVLLLALLLRVALWDNLPRNGMISDEAEYLAAADWLAQGRGFAWHQGWLWTRAPLYPLFLSAHVRLFGLNLAPIYVTQTILSIVNVALVYTLALLLDSRQGTKDERAHASTTPRLRSFVLSPPFIAASLTAVYLPFAAYAQMLLSETLYLTLLLGVFTALSLWLEHRRRQTADRRSWLADTGLPALAGILLGLATLTRGLTLGFLPFVVLWLWLMERRRAKPQALRYVSLIMLLLAWMLTLLPWSIYASRTYGGTVLVDTTGAYNLLLGARTAYDGTRRDAPVRNFVLALLDERLIADERRDLLANQSDTNGRVLVHGSCLFAQDDPRLLAALELPVSAITQAERQQLMIAEGLCLLRATPKAFLSKSLGELVDFFQINYTGAERLSDGFALGWLPRWWTLAVFLLDDTIYVLALPLAVIGWTLVRMTNASVLSVVTLIGLWWLYNLLTAPLLFAINRFRLPLLPFVFILAAYAALMLPRGGWRRLGSGYGLAGATLAVLLFLVAATPYAYLEPRSGGDSRWASYFGPYPSSVASTWEAWNSRSAYQNEQEVMAALGQGDPSAAREALALGQAPTYTYTQAVAMPLIAGLEGNPADGLDLLAEQSIAPLERWQAAVVRGELLRRMDDLSGARATFTVTFVDDANPVAWAWNWLSPPPLPDNRIDLGGNLDLGYIEGFYLGEPDRAERTTWRWSGPEARLRFPGAGRGGVQQFCLRADGRGWPTDMELPQFTLLLDTQLFTTFDLQREPEIYCAPLPPVPPDAAVVVTLQTPVFVPPAADLLGQQGPQVGQLRLLGVKLDWAEIR
ncbi:MAG: hypothetical protein MI924_21430 [Chloroflexales bacterium]|nr:hypothetical protein [Chloroflexales bacterium]